MSGGNTSEGEMSYIRVAGGTSRHSSYDDVYARIKYQTSRCITADTGSARIFDVGASVGRGGGKG